MLPMSSEAATLPDEANRISLNGPTMGSHWYVTYFDGPSDTGPLRAALQEAVDAVDDQMSLWKPDSALNRLNRAPVGEWVPVPPQMFIVLDSALQVGRDSGGAFDIAVGDLVNAWGFGPEPANPSRIEALLRGPKSKHAHDILELDPKTRSARKLAPARFDLGGIAKGFGTDELVRTAARFGIKALTCGIDGDLRCVGTRPDGQPWPVGIELPDYDSRSIHSVVELEDCAIATSGDYRHWVDIQGQRFSHTMSARVGGPVSGALCSVTVLAETCMMADAWATVFLVLGEEAGRTLAKAKGIKAMFLTRQ
ncbi:MAG: FAD:protein FMN transferase [Pseudomonadota bacterium]|nr:FAD:protein FMN transferase [Pseudomonadota bacterium]MEE3071146.1 FAD:protein FMN transferase [Pseudomonadota bacterium]